jgi:dihydrofolate reductase
VIVSLVVAAAENDVIGADGDLPWHLSEDLKRFKELTRGHAVVVGRATEESIERRLGSPLPERHAVVVSRSWGPSPHADVEVARSVPEALDAAARYAAASGQDEIFVIGGAAIYAETLPLADRIRLTRVHEVVDGDAAMPPGWLDGFTVESSAGPATSRTGTRYSFVDYRRA